MQPPVAVGVDVGGTKVLAVALDASSSVVARERVPTPADPDQLVAAIVAAVESLGVTIGSLGVGIAGLVTVDGQVRVSPHLTRPEQLDLPRRLGAHFGVAVRVDNDANAAAWGEASRGAGRGVRDVVVVTLGTGIGAGIVANGELLRGAHGFAGEPGHMTINFDGARHVTGTPGAWEVYGSGTALRAAAGTVLDHDLVSTPEGAALLDAFAESVAIGLSTIVDLLDPQLLVLGGGVSELGEPLRAAVAAHLPKWVLGADERAGLRVVLAELGEDAGAIGAALLGATTRRDPVASDS